MRAKQITEQKQIPLEYLEEDDIRKPRKQGRRGQRRTSLKIKTAKRLTFPGLKIIPKSTPSLSFVRELPKRRFPPTPFLSVLKETQVPVITSNTKFERYPIRLSTPKASLLKISNAQTFLALKTPSSKLYRFEFPRMKVFNKFHTITPEVTVPFEKPKAESIVYPNLRASPTKVKIPDVKTKFTVISEGILVLPLRTLTIDEIQKISLNVSLPLCKESEAFPRIYASKTILQKLLVTTGIPSAEGSKGYPTIRIKEQKIKLLLTTGLPSAENFLQIPRLKLSPQLYVHLMFTRKIPEKKELPLPKAKPLDEIEIQMPSFEREFIVVELPNTVEKFVSAEVERMEGEDLLSELLNIKGYLPKGASEAFDKPIFVLLGQDMGKWHYPIAYLLSELYKEIKGEKPSPTLRDFREYVEEAKNVDSTREIYLMVTFKPWGKIEILDGRKVETSKIKSFFEKIRGRLKTAYLQGLGFFLIVVENDKIQEIEDLLNNIEGVAKITMLPEIPQSKVLKRYDALTYALLGLHSDDFLKALEKYGELLKGIVKTLSFFVPRGIDETQEHSFREAHQYPLKVAVFSYLVDLELKKLDELPVGEEFYKFIVDLMKDGKIRIESPIKVGEREVIPDIIYEGNEEKVYIEIETLIGTEDPLKKIDKTISKYSQGGQLILNGHELWIVLRPVSALIHYEELKHRQKLFELLYGEAPIKFKVLVYDKGWKLLNLETFAKKVREALKETKELREKI
ncbi:hypothetical protein PNA2_1565 [Pyrococcus sp. NA2]|uniref:hypothetical protein n=1 Tax=Pyrococcus sp. (strain NA2) TaxID=342949 RepID=UPI000209A936|nr:hypothetical protein [Pyrococcus sp. NA2]AEC52480.1 hypothetical protein PNA2_1565 [Pyrococcus sp. NA2]